MKEKERVQEEELFFVHLNMLNAGTKGVNAAISSRKHISATTDGGEVRGVKMDVRLCSSKHAKYQSALSTRLCVVVGIEVEVLLTTLFFSLPLSLFLEGIWE